MAPGRVLAGLALAGLLFAGEARAQSLRVSVGAFGAMHLPAGSLLAADGSDGFVRFGHKSGPAGGGRLTLWTGARTGIELEGTVAGAGIDYYAKLRGAEPITSTRKGQLVAGSANLLWAFYKPPLEPIAMYLSLGAAMLKRQGDFFDDAELSENASDLGLIAGLGLRYGVARGVYLRVDVRDIVSSYQGSDRFESRRQHDLFPSIGLDFSVLQ